ncbi:Hypothetical predicted protein [Paramuricea clavata]|uniref:Uncharacterized protein n=1 Tax=Paramuricea clavata TaxID=317549 RepID=A0A6S7H0P0_PARCT|nr:Hypothetical predicted protein [Paramuricea clavata]
MGKLLNYLCIFSVLFAVSYSLRDNNTSVKRSAAKWSLTGWGQAAVARQTSVAATGLTPDKLENAKWKGEKLVVETPAPFFVESHKQPVVISAHYTKYIAWNSVRSLWVSYGISGVPADRICIRGKIESSALGTTFKYAVYMLTLNDDCDSEAELVFVDKNVENGYHTIDFDRITAKCAFEADGLDFILNVYLIQV